MTYYEAYMKCETLEELEEMVKNDLLVAKFINTDRIEIIKENCEKVANLKFNK